MRYLLLASAAGLFLLSAGCSTTASHLTDSENAWMNFQGNGGIKVRYCMANKDKNGAAPICYEAKEIGPEDHPLKN